MASMRTIDWVDGAVEIVDQTALPLQTRMLRLSTVDDLVDAVRRLAVRGAPALGVAGAMGVALAAREYAGDERALVEAVRRLRTARPTAVNLARGVDRAAAVLAQGHEAVLAEALRVRDEEIHSSAEMARLGADLLLELAGPAPPRGAQRRDRQRDPAVAAGRPPDRVGARSARHRVPGRRRRCRTVPDGAGRG